MKKNSSLCCNCSNAESCGHLSRNSNPIIFCEEFTCEPIANTFQASRVKVPQDEVDQLCASCSIYDDCTIEGVGDDCPDFHLKDY